MPPKIGGKLYKKDMSGLQVYFKKFSNMERIFNQFTSAISNGYSEEEFLKKASLLDDEEIKLAATKGFNDISEFLENMLKLNENKELRIDYEACLKVLKILNKKRNFYELIEADASLEKSDEKISHGKSYGIFENWYDKDINYFLSTKRKNECPRVDWLHQYCSALEKLGESCVGFAHGLHARQLRQRGSLYGRHRK